MSQELCLLHLTDIFLLQFKVLLKTLWFVKGCILFQAHLGPHQYCLTRNIFTILSRSGRVESASATEYGWRFSAVVASFVVRTKLLNAEPG